MGRTALPTITALLTLSLAWSVPALAESRVALVVGNAGYGVNDDLTPLPNVRNDAIEMARTLRGLGFKVIVDTDVDKRRLTDRLLELKDTLTLGGRPEVVFVYYSGHGMEIDGRNYLIPLGARIDRKERAGDEATDLQRVLTDLADVHVPATIVVLDSCRNDPFGKGRGPRFKGTGASAGFASIDVPDGMLIAYATKPGTTAMADLPGERLSPFTQVFGQTLAQPGLSFHEVLSRTAAEVKRKTRNQQSPWIEGEPGLQSIVLNGGGPTPATPRPVEPSVYRPPLPPDNPVSGSKYPPPYDRINSASYSCNTPGLSPLEQLICTQPDLARADGVLNQVYKDVRGRLNTSAADTLKREQFAWWRERNAKCTTGGENLIAYCALKMMDSRINELGKMLNPTFPFTVE